MTNFHLEHFPAADELAGAAASSWLDQIEVSSALKQNYSVALSGGRITQKLFHHTVEQAGQRGVSLGHVHFFWADERCVPPTDSESNFRMAQELLFTPLKIASHQIHRIRGEDSPAVAAHQAEAELRGILPRNNAGQPVLDLVFLGLGEDGHVASLFPEEPEAVSADPAVYRAVLNSPKPPPRRVTLGFSAIAAAKQVWMLASGQGKEVAFRESLAGGNTPFARVLQVRAQTRIFTDIG